MPLKLCLCRPDGETKKKAKNNTNKAVRVNPNCKVTSYKTKKKKIIRHNKHLRNGGIPILFMNYTFWTHIKSVFGHKKKFQSFPM